MTEHAEVKREHRGLAADAYIGPHWRTSSHWRSIETREWVENGGGHEFCAGVAQAIADAEQRVREELRQKLADYAAKYRRDTGTDAARMAGANLAASTGVNVSEYCEGVADGLDNAVSVLTSEAADSCGAQVVAETPPDVFDELERGGAPEIVICAALRLPDGRVICGHRHQHCLSAAMAYIEWEHDARSGVGGPPWEPSMGVDQGFITSRNRYVGREEALALQLAAGIPSACPSGYRKGLLFSEDLY
jgi:hypothetical protein